MAKKLTQKDYRWMERKGYKLWRSQLDISGFTPEERKLFLNFWKGRDFQDVPSKVFGELERFGFKKYLKKTIKVYVRVPFNINDFYFETDEKRRSFKFMNDNEYIEGPSIEVEIPMSYGMVTYSGAIEVSEDGSVSFNRGKFLKWVSTTDGDAYFTDVDFDAPYDNVFFEGERPSNKEIFKSFGVDVEGYFDMKKEFKKIVEEKVKEINYTFDPKREELKNRRLKRYEEAKEDEIEYMEHLRKDYERLRNRIFVPILDTYNLSENLTVEKLLEEYEKYPKFPLIERVYPDHKLDHFVVYTKYKILEGENGKFKFDKWAPVKIWVKPYEGIENDYIDYQEEVAKEWDECLDRMVENHSFR